MSPKLIFLWCPADCDVTYNVTSLSVTDVGISSEEKMVMRDLLAEWVAHGPREGATLQYLFNRSIDEVDLKLEPKHIGDAVLADEVWNDINQDGAVRSLITRLRQNLQEFFSLHPIGRKQKYKVEIPKKSYGLVFSRNEPPSMPGSLVKDFWAPYFTSEKPVRLLYPEPLFLRDSRSTVFRNSQAAYDNAIPALSYLNIDEKDLSPHWGYVPSGLVLAMSSLFDCFQRNRTPLQCTPLAPGSKFSEIDEDLIVIGTMASMPYIRNLLAGFPVEITANSVVWKTDGGNETVFNVEDQSIATRSKPQKHWAVLTRRPSQFRGRLTTILSGTHDLAVKAATDFLTRQKELADLVKYVSDSGTFPENFQAVFECSIVDPDLEWHIQNVQIVPKKMPVIGA
jgi:hypothetical protein